MGKNTKVCGKLAGKIKLVITRDALVITRFVHFVITKFTGDSAPCVRLCARNEKRRSFDLRSRFANAVVPDQRSEKL